MSSIEWPEKFVYVCAATQGAIVNTLPIRYAGTERIARMYVMCGASGLDTEDAAERREALAPTLRLWEHAQAMGLARDDFEPLFGDPDDFTSWQRHMRALLEDERNAGVDVVITLTGGRKAMTLGALAGVSEMHRHRLHFVNVRGQPLRVEFIEGLLERNGGDVRQVEAIQHSHLSLEDYLGIYGLREIDPEARRDVEQYYRRWRDCIAEFAEICLENPRDSISALNSVATICLFDERGQFIGGNIDPDLAFERSRRSLRNLLDKLSEMDGIERSGNGVFSVRSSQMGQLIRGGWLEAYIFNRVEQEVLGRNDVEIRANLRLTQHRNESAEIDLALFAGGQLHVIEAKTSSFGKHASRTAGEQSLAQVESLKRLLQAQHGRSWVVNPRESINRLEQGLGDFIPRAQAAGVELLLGRGAVERLLQSIQKVIGYSDAN